TSSAVASPEQYRTLVTTYCTGCHNSRAKTGGVALDAMNFDAGAHDAIFWGKGVRIEHGQQRPARERSDSERHRRRRQRENEAGRSVHRNAGAHDSGKPASDAVAQVRYRAGKRSPTAPA